MQAPLAERMRPKNFDEFIGQEDLLGKEGSLRKLLEKKIVPSMIFWGPPGVGKTTLAGLIASISERPFYTLSAINSGVKDVREVIQKAESQGLFASGNTPILFIDEIHRFSKSQQDSLLGAVEKGVVSLIGATTENPSFEVISALLSRSQVYILKALEKKDLENMLKRALENDQWLKNKKLKIEENEALIRYSGGDARKLLNTLELVAGNIDEGESITNAQVEALLKNRPAHYDKNGEQHYDIISAFIKSIRGSDPNAAVYWLARMIEGGEEPSFIARRLLILASEDIGNANPNALLLANNAFDAVQKIGWPESRIILSQCVIYLATSEKSNASYEAINKAQMEVRNSGDLSVPLPIRNAPTKLMKDLGYGNDYKYAHAYKSNFVDQEFLPKEIEGKRFFEPGENDKEKRARQFLKLRWPKYGY
tara:strand:- start:21490 stop:22761 length:1272 start_codon:yes stop_codon:yes gene_type:complete